MGKLKKKCLIQEEDNTPKSIQVILKKYWPFDGESFKTTPAKVAKEFELNSEELFSTISKYSKVFVYDHCQNCGMEMVTPVCSQIDFLEAYNNKGRCDACAEELSNAQEKGQLADSHE